MTDHKLQVIPLGGLGEFGMNMTAIRYADDIIIVDCGMMFPDAELLGVDLVMPDLTFLKENQQQIRAVVLTHGHEDHIGAVPYFLSEIDVPVYGTASRWRWWTAGWKNTSWRRSRGSSRSSRSRSSKSGRSKSSSFT